MKKETPTTISVPASSESRRSKAREVSSRFLSPTSSIESANSPPPRIKPKSSPTTNSSRSGLWPSSKKQGTLADHLGNDRLKDLLNNEDDDNKNNDGPRLLGRQRSCSEFNRFEKEKPKDNSKENHRPSIIGGSMRYTGKLRFPGGKSSSSSSTSKSSSFTNFVKGRLSVDENNLNRRRTLDAFAESLSSESEYSDYSSGNKTSSTYLSSTASSRRLAGIEVSSRYLHDSLTKSSSRRAESANSTPENSHSFGNLPPKNAVKRASSLTSYKSISQWALSPGRSSSPPMSVENKGKPVPSFSNLRPPHSPSKSKGVGNLLSLGLDLFKSKKSPTNCSSPVGQGVAESSHKLRMFHNRLVQWRFLNARADSVNAAKLTEAQNTLLNARASLFDLQSSVVQKHIKLQKEKLKFKLNSVLQSEIEPLQNWGDIERQHLSALSITKDCLHSVVCRVPLVEGAKVDSHSTSVALRHATDLTVSIKTMLTELSPAAQKEGELLKELAEVVRTEKSLLEECFDLIEMLSSLETHEKSLLCSIVQMKLQQQSYESRQQHQDIVA